MSAYYFEQFQLFDLIIFGLMFVYVWAHLAGAMSESRRLCPISTMLQDEDFIEKQT